jgi:hypothetical protein
MPQAIYALLTNVLFCVSTNPEDMADYSSPIMPGQQPDPTPLPRPKQASIDTNFARRKHYFLLLQNAKHSCFNTLDAQVNNALTVSNDPTIQGWHAGMSTREILDQLSAIYSQPILAAMKLNYTNFCSQYSAANAPKVLFRCIKNCTNIRIMGNNPYTNHQLINKAMHLLLTTGLYQRQFKIGCRLH